MCSLTSDPARLLFALGGLWWYWALAAMAKNNVGNSWFT